MESTVLVAVLTVTAFLAVLIRRYQPEMALGLAVLVGVAVMAAVLRQALPILETTRDLLESASLPTQYTTALFKGMGICLITQLAAETCRDAGETALAAKAELVGRWLLLGIALPLFKQIVTLALSLLQE